MNKLEIQFVDQLSDEIEEIMREDLVNYESSHGIDVNYKRFALVLTDENKHPVGVVNAFTAFSEVYVDDMWVHSLHRGKGYGKKLLKTLEDRFEGKGFNNINLVTNAFNAPDFYKKCGFTEEFVRVNKVNPKLTKTFFIKHFKNTNQTQGILKDKNTDMVLSVNQLTIEALHQSDLDEIVLAFEKIKWHKPKDIYEAYLKEQASGHRSVLVAKKGEKFCGYVTLKWVSNYPFFAEKNIPEIADLNVLPQYQKKGIGTKLIRACENLTKSSGKKLIGLGVGLTVDYGNAQRLYTQLGYVPDGRGLHYKNVAAKYGEKVIVDDELTIYLTKNL